MDKDTHHTGYKKLIQLDVGNLSVSIMGDDRDIRVPGQKTDDYESCVKISIPKRRFQDPPMAELILAEEQDEDCIFQNYSYVLPCRPLFFEQVNYSIYVELDDNDSKIELWHVSQNIRSKIVRPSKKKNVLSGSFSFGSEIGYSDFVFRINGADFVTLTIEVFPSKISYKRDYEQIRNDVIQEVYALIFDALKKTYTSVKLTSERRATKLEFYTIFEAVFSDFVQATDCIIRQPHHQLFTEHEILPVHKVRRTDTTSLKWLEKHPDHLQCTGDGRFMADKIMAVRKYVTYDTKENRLAKHMIERTLYRVEDFKRSYLDYTKESESDGTKRQQDAIFVKQINSQTGIIRGRLTGSFLNDIHYNNENVEMSLVFSMAPGYRELFRCYLKMEQALEIFNDIFNMSQKDLATLYEYWCFIKLNAIVREKLEGKGKKPAVEQDQIITKLKKGSKSEITYKIPESGEKVVLSYNPERKQPTVLQKPDNVLSIEKTGANGAKYEYVFDAKYKIDTKSPYAKENGPGPQEGDINTMHRYRDAIVSELSNEPGVFRRDMYGAYVLFPLEDVENKYRNHPFFTSIQKVNIGGFPFLPSQTDYVTEQIDKLLQGIGNVPDEGIGEQLIPYNIIPDRTDKQAKIIETYLKAISESVLKRPT